MRGPYVAVLLHDASDDGPGSRLGMGAEEWLIGELRTWLSDLTESSEATWLVVHCIDHCNKSRLNYEKLALASVLHELCQ